MGNLFSIDGGLFSFLNKAANLIILNLLCIVCCIPVFTAGASITAMYYVTLKMVKDEESYIVRGFFKSFKQNFKQATIIWLGITALFVLFLVDLRIINYLLPSSTVTNVFKVFMYVIMVFTLLVYIYVFPVLAKFENTIKGTLKNSFIMSIRHLPWTLLMILVSATPYLILYFVTSYGLLYCLLFGASLTTFVNSYFFRKVFAKYITEDPNDYEDRFLQASEQESDESQ